MLSIAILCSVFTRLPLEIRYEIEVFAIRWLRLSAYRNRLNWDVIEPIKAWLYSNNLIEEKPLRLIVEELNKELHASSDGTRNT
jgi:hypothetical protein